MGDFNTPFDMADFILRCHSGQLTCVTVVPDGSLPSNVQGFELTLYDIEEPLKLKPKLSPPNVVLVSHGSEWQDWEDYIQPLARAQQCRMKSENPPTEYVEIG